MIQQLISPVSSNQLTQASHSQILPIPNLPFKFLSPMYLTMSRPQYKRSCGISSLISIFNYQFTTLGIGRLAPITIEEAMLHLNILGKDSLSEHLQEKLIKENKSNNCTELGQTDILVNTQTNNTKTLSQTINAINFGYFTGNTTLIKWYKLLCRIYGVKGNAFIYYKTSGSNKTNISEQDAKTGMINKLYQGKTSFIYHAHDHYFCPVGYEIVPHSPYNEFQSVKDLKDTQIWILIAQPSKCFAPFHIVKWDEIQLDLKTYWPYFYNIRRRQQGVRCVAGKQTKQLISTINCIIAFQKIKD